MKMFLSLLLKEQTDSENVTTQIHDFERQLSAQTLLYLMESFFFKLLNNDDKNKVKIIQ